MKIKLISEEDNSNVHTIRIKRKMVKRIQAIAKAQNMPWTQMLKNLMLDGLKKIADKDTE